MKSIIKVDFNPKYIHFFGIELTSEEIDSMSVYPKEIDMSSDEYKLFEQLAQKFQKRDSDLLFYGWDYKRSYTKEEMAKARLFTIDVRKWFGQFSMEHGTQYDFVDACPFCHSGARQTTPLYLKRTRFLAHRDVASALTNEIVVSKCFVDMMIQAGIKGLLFGDVILNGKKSEDIYQLLPKAPVLEISDKTIFGTRPFDYSGEESHDGIHEIYRCPNGDNLGLQLLSEVYVHDSPLIDNFDFFISRQTFGVVRQLSNVRHIMFCSPRMRRVIIDGNLKGFDFEITNIV